MTTYIEPQAQDWAALCTRPNLEAQNLNDLVNTIFETVKANGDEALKAYTLRFDQVQLNELVVSKDELSQANNLVAEELKVAIQLAKANIERFHAAQAIEKQIITTMPGVECWQEARPIERVGIYIPGGTAPLFSTVLMLAVPAQLAGCKEIILCSPPNSEGQIHPAILYAAQLCGVTRIIKVGGIQAIAALSIGTASVPKVYKIFGPGNQYVTAAKQRALQEGLAIDLPAGPSELLVLADETCNPAFVAADLLSQAEHGSDSQVLCVVNTLEVLKAISKELYAQLEQLPRRDIAQAAIANSKFIVLSKEQDRLAFVNCYAPEHLIICTKNNDYYTKGILNAGSVFVGNYTPESAGDYASGTNHTLPTNGFARAYSGVNLDAFVKKITFQRISPEGIQNIGNAIETLAEAEGLQAHKNAVTIRLNMLS